MATVKGLLCPPDMVVRSGGEEFATTSEALYRCTVSIGVALSEQPADTVEALVARADAAMYRAKKGGRNRVEVVLPVT
jgi:GGDEF domain-containing protein